MSVESVFTSSRPEVLRVWERWAADAEAFNARLIEVEQEFGRRAYSSSGGFGRRLCGLEPTTEDVRGGRLPDGLRLDKKYRPWMLVPAKRTARGKELDAAWSKVHVKPPRYPGMPDMAESPGQDFATHLHTPGYQRVGDVVWCTWGTSAERVTGEVNDTRGRPHGEAFDATIWQQRRLSEYHAMREALDEDDS